MNDQVRHWMSLADDHWKEHRPAMYRELQQSGKLEAALQSAAEKTAREYDQLLDAGQDPHQAWQSVRENHLLLPEEDGLYEETAADREYGERLRDLARMPQESLDAMFPEDDLPETTPSPTTTS